MVTTNFYVASLSGFTALVGFELGSPDPEFDMSSTRPPRRDGEDALIFPFFIFFTGLVPVGLEGSFGKDLSLGEVARLPPRDG